MSKSIATTVLIAIAILEGSSAFAPLPASRANSALNAESGRREMLGDLAKVFGAGAIAVGTGQISGEQSSQLIAGLDNPALGNFRGKYKGQQFIPGKGMRNNEELIAGLDNPALGNFRGKYKGQQFIPGKGMRNQEEIA